MAAVAQNPPALVKSLAENSTLQSIPSEFLYATDSRGSHTDSLPIIDFSLLNSSDHHHRSKTLRHLDHACREWGFFILVNHGIPESLLKAMIEVSTEFFELPEEEKRRYGSKSRSDPVMSSSGSGIKPAAGDSRFHRFWRDFVKANIHPEFNCPSEPQALRKSLQEYTEKTRSVFRQLMHAIGENLGLQEGSVDQDFNLESCFQLYAANYYPPFPHPDQAIGIPPHTDYGFLTFLIHNGITGLQIQHDGEWFDILSPPNAILVNSADHLHILSNGRYKSVKHRATVNTEATRISVVINNGPAPDVVVAPAPQLAEQDGRPHYRPMKFSEYMESLYTNGFMGKTGLEHLKIQDE